MQHLAQGEKIVIGMVGLPARGKTYISKKIARYLNWSGLKCQVFNIGEYRRDLYGTKECTANFFDHDNAEANKARTQCAILALEDLIQFLENGGDVAIYDGTNTTVERRTLVKEVLEKKLGACQLMWVESICQDESIIESNIRQTKLSSPDYREQDSETATRDFKNRIAKYAQVYEEISKEKDGQDTSYIKLFNVGQQFEMNKIAGYIPSKIVAFLMNLHIIPRPIYFVRPGESTHIIENRVGGDADLTEEGVLFAQKLNKFFQNEFRSPVNGGEPKPVKILTSTMKRAKNTVNALELNGKPVCLKILDELNAGDYDGMTYDEIAEKYPLQVKDRNEDKLKYRYPRGESYLDVIQRIEPIIFEIERTKSPVVVVGHQAILRCLYAYFNKHDIEEIPFISIPLSTVIKLTPDTYYANEWRFFINSENGNVSKRNISQPDRKSVV